MTTKYRAAYYVSQDGQNSLVLTTPDQAHLSDAELHAAAIAEAERMEMVLEAGDKIVIGEWTE